LQQNRFALRTCAALATCVLLLLSGWPLVAARARAAGAVAEAPPAAATAAAAPATEANIDATGISAGALRISILARELPAGAIVWQRPDGGQGGAVAPLNVHLVSSAGAEAAVAVEPGGIRAEVAAGDWTLTYELPWSAGLEAANQGSVAGPGGGSVVIAPADCLYLPPERPVNVSLTAPVGWGALANAPAACRDMTSFRLQTVSFLLMPDAPRIIAEATVGPVRAAAVARKVALSGGQGGAGSDAAALAATLGRLVSAFSDAVPVADPTEAYVFVDGAEAPTDLAGRLLDALWASWRSGGAPEERLLDDALWPLLRDALLTANGYPPDAGLARRICDEHRAYCVAAPAGEPPLAAAPLATLCLLARALDGGAPALARAAATQLRSVPGPEGPQDFVEGWAAAVAGSGSASARAAAELLLRFAGRGGGLLAPLPDLPDDVLALGDPDRDNDGLPDRIDPAPDEKGISLAVAGRTVRLDAPPLIIGGRVMVPLRFFAERLGFAVAWDEVARTATVSRGDSAAVFPVGTHYFLVNNRAHYLDAPTAIVDGRTMVSLRFAAKALDVGVTWDAATRTVNVWPDQPYSNEASPPVGGRRAYLTFDDGPEPGMTPRILSVLQEYRASATFFVIGSVAARHTDLLRQIVGAGHGLGNHTFTHDTNAGSPKFVYRSPEAYLAELAACESVIAAATGASPRATRPPGGSYPHLTEDFRCALRVRGYLTYDWNASAADSALPRPTVEQVITNIMTAARDGKRSQLIVLMHDGGRNHETTLAALPAVIEYLRACGYEFGVLPGAATVQTASERGN